MKFKVWIEIEPLSEDGDELDVQSGDLGILPDSAGTFDTFREAIDRQAEIVNVFGVAPESSDALTCSAEGKYPDEVK